MNLRLLSAERAAVAQHDFFCAIAFYTLLCRRCYKGKRLVTSSFAVPTLMLLGQSLIALLAWFVWALILHQQIMRDLELCSFVSFGRVAVRHFYSWQRENPTCFVQFVERFDQMKRSQVFFYWRVPICEERILMRGTSPPHLVPRHLRSLCSFSFKFPMISLEPILCVLLPCVWL